MAARRKASPAAHALAAITTAVAALVSIGAVWPWISLRGVWMDASEFLVAFGVTFTIAALVGFLVYRNALRLAVRFIPAGRTANAVSISTDAVLAALGHSDFACRVCGYNLRGIQTPNCPECSTAVALVLCDAESRPSTPGFTLALTWAFASLVGHVLNAIANVILLVRFISTAGIRFGMASRYDAYILLYVFGALLSIAVVITALARLLLVIAVKPQGYAQWAHTTIVLLVALNLTSLVMTCLSAATLILGYW